MKQEYVIKAAYYKGKIDAVQEIIKIVQLYIAGSEEGKAEIDMYREAMSETQRKIMRDIGDIKYECNRR